jgi:hypothetical protein
MLDGTVYMGDYELVLSPAQTAAARRLGLKVPARLERLEGLWITDDDFPLLPEMLELDSSVLALKGETARWATPPPRSSCTCCCPRRT